MPLISTSWDDTPRERLSLYRAHEVTHAVLLLPFESLSRLQREVALRLAAEWGQELAEMESARAEIAHAEDPAVPLAGLWLVRVSAGPIHAVDAMYWTQEADRWRVQEGTDPRIAAFRDAWREAAEASGPIPPPGPKCRCPACRGKYRTSGRKDR